MVPNYDEKTGIHYGVINANSLDPETLDQIIIQGKSAYEVDFEEELVSIRSRLERFIDSAAAAEIIEGVKTSFYENMMEDDSPVSFSIEGVSGEYSRNNNVIMIFKSPYYASANRCSPCYPNAGDLDTLIEHGFDTYAPPPEWWDEYRQKSRESMGKVKLVTEREA